MEEPSNFNVAQHGSWNNFCYFQETCIVTPNLSMGKLRNSKLLRAGS